MASKIWRNLIRTAAAACFVVGSSAQAGGVFYQSDFDPLDFQRQGHLGGRRQLQYRSLPRAATMASSIGWPQSVDVATATSACTAAVATLDDGY